MLKLRIHPLVAADLKEIRDYIAEDRPENAIGQYHRIAEAILTLESFPERHP